MKQGYIAALWLAMWLPAAAPAQGGAHVHGAAHLSLVQEGGAVTVALDSPLEAIVGFEHAPKTAEQKAALTEAAAALKGPDALVQLPAAAACRLTDSDIDLPFMAADVDHGHAHAGHDDHDGHADVTASYTFACAQPDKLDRVTVKAFARFPRLHHIDAEAATAAGQGKAVLDAAHPVWSLPAKR
ncbi:DUF2796 domain-containing protein [Denitromonas iodatirespirans]|uniref:DUF2796 domain-containing protein n=1 Tax=Denitromonas iodatirespirans TaxID=2795389 RepID=A0A944H693_DENI1|nr:DUF2796 domain-containing protein [Denitromonas iodatirespirans]MBT0959933.1 DUF2796 domain-containing protein [Denitromonas iodatirespirans]